MTIQKFSAKFERLTADQLAPWKGIPPAVASDCMNRGHVMASRISPLAFGMTLCGQARTVTSMVGDHSATLVAIDLAEPGDILVIDARGHTETAVWGGVMTQAALARGIAGIVVDGAVRDAAEIRQLGFPTFASGICPAGPNRGFGGAVDGPISCGACPVQPGDIVIGDDDGIAVIPLRHREAVLRAALLKLDEEKGLYADIKSGRSLATRFGLVVEDMG